jgi:UDP-N-acetyl-D-mannosaminuronate dehydrogenase
MQVGVYGSGYLATVVSGCLADFGTPVTCYDDDGPRIYSLAQGDVPFHEKNLKEVLRRNARAGRLVYSTELESFAGKSAVIFLANDSHHYVEDLALKVAQAAGRDGVLVIMTPSSSPPAAPWKTSIGPTASCWAPAHPPRCMLSSRSTGRW